MSGLVHLSSVTDDFYVFDTERSQLTGRRNRRVIRLGDKVQVQIAKVDSFKKQVDFRLAQDAKSEWETKNKSERAGRGHKPEHEREQIPTSHSRQRFSQPRRRR
jgi:ribonuclease R